MTTRLAGPMFEGARSGFWQSTHGKDGGHYNNYGCDSQDGMAALREMFPDGEANDVNFVLFSTSGIHGTYGTIEDAEELWKNGGYEPNDAEREEQFTPEVTFLVVQPRICTVRHGNCQPESEGDFAFLRKLRQTSWDVVPTIGRP